MKHRKSFPIWAGMQFTYPGTKNDKLHVVGYYTIEFTYNNDGQLVSEKEIKRIFL